MNTGPIDLKNLNGLDGGKNNVRTPELPSQTQQKAEQWGGNNFSFPKPPSERQSGSNNVPAQKPQSSQSIPAAQKVVTPAPPSVPSSAPNSTLWSVYTPPPQEQAKTVLNRPQRTLHKNFYFFFAVILIGIILTPAVWTLVSSVWVMVVNFMGGGNVTFAALTQLFAGFMAIIAVMCLLATPTSKLKSPIFYIVRQIGNSGNDLKLAGEQKVSKKPFITSILIYFMILFILLSSYFFLIKNLIVIHNGEVVGTTILGMLIKIGIIYGYLLFTSFMVTKFEEIEDSKEAEEQKEQKKNWFTLWLIVGTILVIGMGNTFANIAVEKISTTEMWAKIVNFLGGTGNSVNIWNESLKIR